MFPSMLTLAAPSAKNVCPSASSFSSMKYLLAEDLRVLVELRGRPVAGIAYGQRHCTEYCLPSKLRP